MDNHKLTKIFNDIQRVYFPKKYQRISAEFYPFRTLRHIIEWTPFSIRAKVSRQLQNAPVHILQVLALLLLARIYKQRVSTEIRNIYNEYLHHLPRQERRINHTAVVNYRAKGKVYDLREIFDQINVSNFDNELEVEIVGWSKRKSYTRLGFYDPRRNLLVISQIFDTARVPKEVVRYLVFHEMLHIKIPGRTAKGVKKVHTKEFRYAERRYPNYTGIQEWIKKNLKRL